MWACTCTMDVLVGAVHGNTEELGQTMSLSRGKYCVRISQL
jgi:hypothetical protein